MAVHDHNIMLTTPVSLSLSSWPIAPLLRRVFATLVSASRTSSKIQPKTLALEVKTRRHASNPLTVLLPITSSRLVPSDSPRVAFDPLVAHLPQPITSLTSLLFWLCEGLEMAGSQFTGLCKTKPLGEHEGPDEKNGSDADNGGSLAVSFLFHTYANAWTKKPFTRTSSSHHQSDIPTASLLLHHREILVPSFPDRSTVAVFRCRRTLAS